MAKHDIIPELLENIKYKREVGELKFTASMFGNTDLQNFLTIVYGAEEPTEIGQAQIGSIAHKGMEHLLTGDASATKEEKFVIENFKDTGWILSGTADRVSYDADALYFHDYKFTKKYAGQAVKKDLSHGYRMQLNTLRYLYLNSKGNNTTKVVRMFLDMFYKDADVLYLEPSYEQIEILPMGNIEEELHKKVLSLDALIKAGEMPPECDRADKWIRKLKNGKTVASRCVAYCSVAHVCPYYKAPSTPTTVSNW